MNLVLGDVVETIYVADEDDDDKEDIKVGPHAKRTWPICLCSQRYRLSQRSRRCCLFEVCVSPTPVCSGRRTCISNTSGQETVSFSFRPRMSHDHDGGWVTGRVSQDPAHMLPPNKYLICWSLPGAKCLAEEGAAGIFPKSSTASFPYLIAWSKTSTRPSPMGAFDSLSMDANASFTWPPFTGQTGALMKSAWLTPI